MANGWSRRSFPGRWVHAFEVSPDGALLAIAGATEIAVWAIGGNPAEPLYSVPHLEGFHFQLAVDADQWSPTRFRIRQKWWSSAWSGAHAARRHPPNP